MTLGASNDSDTMWQIGIDVLPEYRKMGVATTLTKILTDEIVKQGKVPYYCTAWSNIASKCNAIKCGYKTAWVEMTAINKKDAMKMIGECT
jgi:predicted GNAT family acetyltransferase